VPQSGNTMAFAPDFRSFPEPLPSVTEFFMSLKAIVTPLGGPLLLFLGLLPASAGAQRAEAPHTAADPADVASADAIVAAVYDVISGPAGKARDWDRWRSLFLPEARLVAVGRAQDGTLRHRVMTPEDYVQGSGPMLEETGFFEREVHRIQEEFGPVVHLFSTYESRRSLEDPEPFARGINSFQLMYDGSRWWVLTIFWTSERPDLPIPARYLPGG